MATSNKIVDTRRLAAKGRFGDTKIRNVRGKPSHVTALEAYHMDTVGVQPSASKKSINPMTGLPEYHGEWYTGHPLHHQTLLETGAQILDTLNPITQIVDVYEDLSGQDAGYDTLEDWVTDPGGTTVGKWWTKNVTDKYNEPTRLIEQQSKDIMTGGMENLQTQYGQYMGNAGPDGIVGTPDDDIGIIAEEAKLREDELEDVYGTSMEKYGEAELTLGETSAAASRELKGIGDVQRKRFGGAYSGTVEQAVEEGQESIGKQFASGTRDIGIGRTKTQDIYDVGMRASALGAEKSEADFMGGLRKQMNIMMTDYISATGEAYGDTGAGSMWEELNTLFDQYSENV